MVEEIHNLKAQGMGREAIADALGIGVKQVRNRLAAKAWEPREAMQVDSPIPEGLPIHERIARRVQDYEYKAAKIKAQAFRRINVKMDGPVGILHFGDPHIDDDGTDIGELFYHAELTRTTPGLFGANIGDTTNNWVGRLARLYGEQGTSAEHGRELAEYFLKSVDWLYVVLGNHDMWGGGSGVVDWFAKQYGYMQTGQFQPHAVRLGLVFPNGKEIRVNARHDFRGASEHHPTHGPAKAARMGFCDHIAICGHRHQSGYEIVVSPDPMTGDGETGLITHCIRVATYKKIDSFQREKGFPYNNTGPGVVTVINPDATKESNLIQVFLDPAHGADYLTWLRGKK
jgi:hypothetical protein